MRTALLQRAVAIATPPTGSYQTDTMGKRKACTYMAAGILSSIAAPANLVSGLSHGFPRVPLSAHHAQSSVRAAAPLPLVGNRGRGQRGDNACCWGAGGGKLVHGPVKAGWGVRLGARRREGNEWSLGTTTEPASTAASSMGARNLTTPAAQFLTNDGSPETIPDGESHLTSKAAEGEEGGVVNTLVNAGGGDVDSGKKRNLLTTLWEFSRPHTMIGTAIAIPAVGVFAAPPGVLPGRHFLLAMVWAMVPSLLINVYITGLNQITDVEIDKVNKPYLPIPAGHLSPRAAKLTVTACLLAGVMLGLAPCALGSPGLSLTVVLSVLIGTSYSLPPLRLKRFPQVAALCILVVRGSIINGGFYSHAQAVVYGLAPKKTAWWALTLPLRDIKCALALGYFTVFAVVIALMKDVPDVAGDRKFNIPSFSVVLGEAKLFAFARRLLTTLLWSTAAALGLSSRTAAAASLPWTAVSRAFAAVSALASGQLVRARARGVDPEKPSEVYGFYMFLWKIFYASYLVLPLAR